MYEYEYDMYEGAAVCAKCWEICMRAVARVRLRVFHEPIMLLW